MAGLGRSVGWSVASALALAACASSPPSSTALERAEPPSADPCAAAPAPLTVSVRGLSADEVALIAQRPVDRYGGGLVLAEVTLTPPGPEALSVVNADIRGPAEPLAGFFDRPPPPTRPFLPPGPFVDQPAARPNFVSSVVEPLLKTTLMTLTLPATIPLSIATNGQSGPETIFRVRPPPKKADMFSDELLDEDAWQQEAAARAQGYLTKASAWETELRARQAAIDALRAWTRTECGEAGAHCVLRLPFAADGAPAEGHRLELRREYAGVCARRERISISVPAVAALSRPTEPLEPKQIEPVRAPPWAASDAAAPSWASRGDRVTPQLAGVAQLFSKLKPRRAATLTGATLVCRVAASRTREWDAFRGAPDLDVRLAFGRVHGVGRTVRGPGDRHRVTFSLPQVSLAAGDRIKLSLVDRDLFEHDWGGSAVVPFSGELPIPFAHRHFSAECRALDAGAAARASRRAHKAFDRSLRRARRKLQPKAQTPQLGFPVQDVEAARTQVVSMAAVLGWQGAQAAAGVAALAALDEAWSAKVAPLVATLRTEARQRRSTTWRGLKVEPLGVRCAVARGRPGCRALFAVTAGRGKADFFSDLGDKLKTELTFVTDHGRELAPSEVAGNPPFEAPWNNLRLAPGEQGELSIQLPEPLHAEAGTEVLARFKAGRRYGHLLLGAVDEEARRARWVSYIDTRAAPQVEVGGVRWRPTAMRCDADDCRVELAVDDLSALEVSTTGVLRGKTRFSFEGLSPAGTTRVARVSASPGADVLTLELDAPPRWLVIEGAGERRLARLPLAEALSR